MALQGLFDLFKRKKRGVAEASNELDIWHTFPTQLGEKRAFITYNHTYAEIAEKDERDSLLKVRVKIKNPDAAGMPTNKEFSALSALDDKLDGLLTKEGAIYVGRITIDGYRVFHFYLNFPEQTAAAIVNQVAKKTSYTIDYSYQKDPAKDGYWKALFPTRENWQVIQDMKVLYALRMSGDNPEKSREVFHWAYFQDMKNANSFGDWIKANQYKLISIEFTEDKQKVGVKFSHVGSMALEDITHHSIDINRTIAEMEGDYDGWETSVER
jgi:Family of unknown function (DUF695)/Regulator of ribonuclease activity B